MRHVASLISKICQVVVAARSPKFDAILRRKTNKGAILDQATRWGSTYLMLERLLELKPALIDIVHPDVSLSDAQWNEVKQLEGLLHHPFLTTKKLNINHNDFRRISTQVKLINDDSIKNINRLKLYRVKL